MNILEKKKNQAFIIKKGEEDAVYSYLAKHI